MAGIPLPFDSALLRSQPDGGEIRPGLGAVLDVLCFSCKHDTDNFGEMEWRVALAKELMPHNRAIAKEVNPLFVFSCALNSRWVMDTLVNMYVDDYDSNVGCFCVGHSTTHKGYGNGNLQMEGRATCV